MSVNHARKGRVVVIHWDGKLEVDDAVEGLNDARKAFKALGGPFIGIAILGKNIQRPGDDVRKQMVATYKEMLDYHEIVHIVHFENPLIATGIMAFITLAMTALSEGKIHNHWSVEGALIKALEEGKVLGESMGDILAHFREKGIPLRK